MRNGWEAYHFRNGDLEVIPRGNIRRKLKGEAKQANYGSHKSTPRLCSMLNMTSKREDAECTRSHATCELDHMRSSSGCVVTAVERMMLRDLPYFLARLEKSYAKRLARAERSAGDTCDARLGAML